MSWSAGLDVALGLRTPPPRWMPVAKVGDGGEHLAHPVGSGRVVGTRACQ
jgi:hypothetical protein